MKVLDKIALVLFSCIVLIISVLSCLVIFGWIPLDVVTLYIEHALNDSLTTNVSLGVLVVLILLAVKGIFFSSDTKTEKDSNDGILIQNENGKLFVSKETIQNLVSGVVKEVEGAQDVLAKVVLTKANEINIDVVLYVSENVIITELSTSLQTKIKEVIKKTIDVDIKEVNIQIKNITPKQENV